MPVIDQFVCDDYAIYHADTMEVLPTLPSLSVDMSVYSPPFPELYQYSDDPRDMTNCTSYNESIDQYRYVVTQVERLTKPGRISCVHCTDLKRGQLYQRDFPGDIIRVHEEVGMHFFCRVTVWKDPWHFARRTRTSTLMHKTIVIDSSCSRIAPADYILVFKKAGKNEVPITHERGFREYAGERSIPSSLAEYVNYKGDQRANSLSHWIYRQYASPVWMDIRRDRLLPYDEAKEDPEEKHVCPLQLDSIDRCLAMWSNPGETILSPFMGVGSEVYESVRLGRRGVGIELKGTYYRQAAKNMERATKETDRASLSEMFFADESPADESELSHADD
jgi:DNA modification methylase